MYLQAGCPIHSPVHYLGLVVGFVNIIIKLINNQKKFGWLERAEAELHA